MPHQCTTFDGNSKLNHVKVLAALKGGWRHVILHRKMVLILYLSNLVIAVIATMAFRGWLKNAAEHSLALTKSMEQFDFTFVMDLIRNYGGLSVLCHQAMIITLAYLIYSAFLAGGMLSMFIHHERFSVKEFMAGGALYFWRTLRLALYFLLLQIGLLAILLFVFMAIGINPKEMESDVQFLRYFRIILPIYLFAAMVIAIIHDYVKIHVVTQNANPMMKAFGAGTWFVFGHFGSVLLLYVINLFLLVALFLVYFQAKLLISTSVGILSGFLLSQLFLVGRIGVKLLILSSASTLVQLENSSGFPSPSSPDVARRSLEP